MGALTTVMISGLLLTGQAWAQQPEWRTKKVVQARVWTATVRAGNATRLTMSCRDSGRRVPELTLEVVADRGSALAGAPNATASVGSGGQTMALVAVGAEMPGGTVLRRTVIGPEGFAEFRRLADTISEGEDIEVSAPGGRRQAFPPDRLLAAVPDTVLRCAPSVIGIRSRVADQRNATTLVALSNDANERCRGGSGDNPETHIACAERTEIGERLAVIGWCYGRQGQAGYQMNWHQCGRDSIR